MTAAVAPVREPRAYFARVHGVTWGPNPSPERYEEDYPYALPRIPGAMVLDASTISLPENAIALFRGLMKLDGATWDERMSGPPPFSVASVDALLSPRLNARARGYIRDSEYQSEGLKFICGRDGSALHWSPGAGKTIVALAYLLADSGDGLFVTTAAARPHIAAQTRDHTDVSPVVLRGEKPTPVDRGMGIYVISYNALPAWLPVLRKLKFRKGVFDEIHADVGAKGRSRFRMKKVRTKTGDVAAIPEKKNNVSAACMDLSRIFDRRLATTATPVMTYVRDLWGQLDIIEPRRWGRYRQWGTTYAGAEEGAWGGLEDTGKSSQGELRLRLDAMRHLVPYSVTHAGLPAKRRKVTRIPLEEQNAEGAEFTKLLRNAAKKTWQQFREVKLAQAAVRKRAWIVKNAFERLTRGQKMVLFTGRRNDVAVLRGALTAALAENGWKIDIDKHDEKLGLTTDDGKVVDHTVTVVTTYAVASSGPDISLWACTGADDDDHRYAVARCHLRADDPCALIATLDSMGESIDLQRTDWMCFGMLPERPGRLIQGEGRVNRKGQDREVLCEYPVAVRSYDEYVATALLDKLEPVESVVGDSQVAALIPALAGTANPDEVFDRLFEKIGKEVMESEAAR